MRVDHSLTDLVLGQAEIGLDGVQVFLKDVREHIITSLEGLC